MILFVARPSATPPVRKYGGVGPFDEGLVVPVARFTCIDDHPPERGAQDRNPCAQIDFSGQGPVTSNYKSSALEIK